MGGNSSEKEISMQSGEAIYQALVQKGYFAERFILSTNNVADIILMKPTCVFLALHGKGGEDGSIQGMLELAGIPYTGSGVASSAICMNKILTKKILVYEGIRTAKFVSISVNEEYKVANVVDSVIEKLEFPVVVKASSQGSSVGVMIARSKEELPFILENVYMMDHEVLVEEYLYGKELTVAVMKEPQGITVFPIIEIVSENNFYDYESKYTIGKSHHIIPARIDVEIKKEIELLAVSSYKALNCDGLVRIDYMLGNNNEPYVIEVNTIPGMTKTSLVPDAAKARGQEFSDLVSEMVEMTIYNHKPIR